MARRKYVEEEVIDPQDDLGSLLAGTNFGIIKDFKVLNNNRKIPTPIEALNCMLGGGLPFGIVLNSYGRSKTGKSTWLYQMMALFQKEYPEGICFIIDTETSGDPSRAKFFGVDTDRVIIMCPPSIESGFLAIQKMLDNKSKNANLKNVPVFGIWDSIGNGLAQDGSTQSRMNAQDRARVIKNYMGPLMSAIEDHEFFLGVVNQVVVQSDAYGNRKDVSGGGVALEHQVHVSTKFSRFNGDVYEGAFLTRRTSILELDKSKIGPEMKSLIVLMDITQGGMIDVERSFTDYMTSATGFIPNKSGWHKLDDLINVSHEKFYFRTLCNYNKSYRYNDLLDTAKNDRLFFNLLKLVYMSRMSEIYQLQSQIIEPYLIKTANEMRVTEIYPELSIKDDEEYRQVITDTIVGNPELYSTLMDNLDKDKAICLKCGTPHDSLWGCECDGQVGAVVLVATAKSLLDTLVVESHSDDNYDVAENTDEVMMEDSVEESEVIEGSSDVDEEV